MLGKLLKYEFGATARTFLPLYAALAIASLLMNIGVRFPELDLMIFFSGLLLFALFIALGVVTLLTVIQRFSKNLLSDEGYLMFTLPVSVTQLMFSKLIVAIVWIVCSGLVGIVSGLVIAANHDIITAFKELWNNIPPYWWVIAKEYIVWAIVGIICIFTQMIYFVLLIYTSLSVSQMAPFQKHRRLVSFIAFIIIYVVVNSITMALFGNVFDNMTTMDKTQILPALLMAIGTNTFFSGVMFAGTYYFLKHHLNLE